MTSNFGATAYSIYPSSGIDVMTSGGVLDISSDGGWTGDATFAAVVGSPTPEPSSLTLFGSGLLAMAYLLRRKRFAQS
jgi:hypothetical protein